MDDNPNRKKKTLMNLFVSHVNQKFFSRLNCTFTRTCCLVTNLSTLLVFPPKANSIGGIQILKQRAIDRDFQQII